MQKLTSALLLLLFIQPAFAKPTFGAEFTMTSSELTRAKKMFPHTDDDISTEVGRKLLKAFADDVKKRCPECKVVPGLDLYELPLYKVTLPDQFSFSITLDPAVIEIVPESATIEGFKKLEPLLENLVFKVGETLKQKPSVDYGGGHIHVGIDSAFEGNPVLFRNFFVDWLNHQDFMSALMGSKYNSPTFYDLDKSQGDEMRKVVAEFDFILAHEGFVANPKKDTVRGAQLIEIFATMIQKRVYTKTLIASWTPAEKYHALNVTRIVNHQVPREQKTIELRFFESQKSVREFISITELIEGRLEYLATQTELVTYEVLRSYSAKETADRFIKYSGEAARDPGTLKKTFYKKDIAKFLPDSGVTEQTAVAVTQKKSSFMAGLCALAIRF